jgi:hypothetical protein
VLTWLQSIAHLVQTSMKTCIRKMIVRVNELYGGSLLGSRRCPSWEGTLSLDTYNELKKIILSIGIWF